MLMRVVRTRSRRLTVNLRFLTTLPAALMTNWLVVAPAQSMVIDLVMVAPPKEPESRQLISPSSVVASWANEKLLHGAARVHGPPGLPVDDTKVFSICACAGAAARNS